ncbi:anthranilate synthase component I family protein [Hugenholtzia roseola]|uniref:anthranilate synthase component I family protein n=1 Tax=Hugenholtzia roseola TaxID=1002 RepID=UPI0004044D56|nr:anthranilate synthase component I family protein [Hugenholtzia roseola]
MKKYKVSRNFKEKILQYSLNCDTFLALDSAQILYPKGAFRLFFAFGSNRTLIADAQTPDFLTALADFQAQAAERQHWILGYLGYDLKNQIESFLKSQNPDALEMPEGFFFEPTYLIEWLPASEQVVFWQGKEPEKILQEIENIRLISHKKKYFNTNQKKKTILPTVTQKEYEAQVEKLKNHIEEGDIYEINYCIEFLIQNFELQEQDCIALFSLLSQHAPMPFSAYLKWQNFFVLCASPERFLKKEGKRLISQPIKGTIRRGKNAEEDEILKHYLKNNEKERAENMMIVDLVRNDLARSATIGTTEATELFGIYTFKQLHQMISTVEAELAPDCTWAEALRHAFPMGSMTGAPKIRAMQLIEAYEKQKRGLYSGAIGFVSPSQDFDFNVVIRTFLYHKKKKLGSFQVGSAITIDALPEKEWEECLLKAETWRKLLSDYI